jgi:diguanylate cyclase (GGDEF)-like protein
VNLLSIVNQIFDQYEDDEASKGGQLLGLPGALVGIDLNALAEDLLKHREALETLLGRPVHEAAALLDMIDQAQSDQSIDDYCVLRKEAMQDLMQAAIYDKLTGLFSRNTMDTRLRDEYRRAKRYDLPLSALFVDVDDFKTINDNHGHSEGDRALSFLGRFILDRLREVDIPIRYGGEEFVVILPHTDGETALALANQLRDGIGSAQEQAGLAQSLTISIGVGTLTPEMTSDSELVDAADRAVYLAKEKKNLVWPGLNGAKVDSGESAG